jgi:hypothetical protein
LRAHGPKRPSRPQNCPLGVVQDPRLTNRHTGLPFAAECSSMARMFALKALRVQAQVDSNDALTQIETALALSRQVENFAPAALYRAGCEMEGYAYRALERWLEKVGPDRDLLHTAAAILQHHEANKPPLVNSLKAEYLIYRNSKMADLRVNAVLDKAVIVASKVPWEKERQRRLGNALFLQQIAQVTGLPVAHGPTVMLSAEQWRELFRYSSWDYRYGQFYMPLASAADANRTRRILLLALAVAQYQTEHGSPPNKLDALVPGYLPRLPVDPGSGQPFGYRVSQGEQIEGATPDKQLLAVAPGQALIECSGNWGAVLLVPMWPKK